MNAIVLGASGATGKDMMQCLLAAPDVEHVLVLSRRPLTYADPRVEVLVVDFDKPSEWAAQVKGDVLFSMLGTTRDKAGSKDAQWLVDYTYQESVARAACDNGVGTMVLMSAVGADAKSLFFYTRMKGQLELSVCSMGFPRTVIVRPPSLIRKDTDRPAERITVKLLNGLNRIGLLRKMAPVTTEAVAQRMLDESRKSAPKLSIITLRG